MVILGLLLGEILVLSVSIYVSVAEAQRARSVYLAFAWLPLGLLVCLLFFARFSRPSLGYAVIVIAWFMAAASLVLGLFGFALHARLKSSEGRTAVVVSTIAASLPALVYVGLIIEGW